LFKILKINKQGRVAGFNGSFSPLTLAAASQQSDLFIMMVNTGRVDIMQRDAVSNQSTFRFFFFLQ
jgi:hypothetical protein